MSPEKFEHYKLNHEVIDLQHLLIFEKVEKIVSKIKNTQCIKADIFELLDMVEKHLDTENYIMNEAKYPFINFHLLDHAKLVLAVYKLKTYTMTESTIDDLYSIARIFETHIIDYDLSTITWINEHSK